jgi:signal transduction histidine kinase
VRAPRLSARTRSALFDVLVAGCVLGLTLFNAFDVRLSRWLLVPGLVMGVAILLRRRWPVSTMAVVALTALAQVLIFPSTAEPLPYDVAVLIAMYSVVKYAPRLRDAYLAAAVVGAGIVIQVIRQPGDWFALALWYVGVCGGVWLMAYTLRNRRMYVVGLEERAATLEREREHLARIAVADERAAIARELHDVVAHSLAVMIVQAEGGRYAFHADPRQALTVLETVAATGREALDDMRGLVGVLRGSDPADAQPGHTAPGHTAPGHTGAPATADAGAPALRGDDLVAVATDRRRVGAEHLGVLAERARSAGLLVSIRDDGGPGVLPRGVEIAVYRVAQEALTNVLRHAGPGTTVAMTVLRTPTGIELRVEDDGGPGTASGPSSAHGRAAHGAAAHGGATGGSATHGAAAHGAAAHGAAAHAGHGLVGMRERVAVHGGVFSAGPRTGGGWAVTASIPLRPRVTEGVAG